MNKALQFIINTLYILFNYKLIYKYDSFGIDSYSNYYSIDIEPACRWCGESQETIFPIFQECPQLAVERLDARVSNPRDLWDAPAVALRFAGAIGLIPGLY